MADSVQSLIDGILEDMPPGANPWTLLRGALTAEVRPDLGTAFRAQMYTLSALIAASTVVLVLCMAVKWRQGTYWLFRVHRATGGLFLVVHYAQTWTTAIIVFFGVLQGYIWQTVKYNSGDNVPNSDLWRMCVWYPGWLAFWLAAWSLRVSHILHLDSSGRPSRAFYSQAWFLNTGGVLVPCLCAVAIAVLAWKAHGYFVDAMSRFALMDAKLAAAEASYVPGTDTENLLSQDDLQLADNFSASLSSFGDYFRGVFWAYFGFTVLLEAILILTTIFHLRELRATMNDLRGRAHQSDEAREQEEMIERGYKGLRAVAYAIVGCCTAVNVLFAYVAIAGRKVIYDEKYSEVASLLPLWLFSILGVPLSLLFLQRIIKSAPNWSPNEGSPSVQESGSFNAARVLADNHSNPSSVTDRKAAVPAEQYAMTSLGFLASHPPAAKSDEYASLRQDSPTLSASSGAQLVSAPNVELPFFAGYEARQPAQTMEVAQAEMGTGRWAPKKLGVGGRSH